MRAPRRPFGHGVSEILVWLPASGLVAALFGVLVAPLAVRLRGLSLAIVTLGLVFVGGHVFTAWSELTGGPGVGRQAAEPVLFGYPLNQDGPYLTKDQQMYLLMLVLVAMAAGPLPFLRGATAGAVARAGAGCRPLTARATNATTYNLSGRPVTLTEFRAAVASNPTANVVVLYSPASGELLRVNAAISTPAAPSR